MSMQHFFQLREHLSTCRHTDDDTLLLPRHISDKLLGIRKISLHLCDPNQPDTATNRLLFYEEFMKCWYTLSELKDNSPYYLPPPHSCESDILSGYAKSCSEALYSTERGDRPPGNNPIFCGYKGVGKTTLLVTIGKIASVMLVEVIPMYWSYETVATFRPSLQQMVDAITVYQKKYREGEELTFEVVLRDVVAAGPSTVTKADSRRFLFLIDEFTLLYNDENREVGRRIIMEIQVRGKNYPNNPIFLAASVICIEKYIYPSLSGGKDNFYPALNNTVFFRRTIHPIRCQKALAAYATRRYPGWDFDPASLLDRTGGIGRFVAAYRSDFSMSLDPANSYVFGDKALFGLFCALLAAAPENIPADGPWPVWSIDYMSGLGLLIKVYGYSDTEAVLLIDLWCDRLLFYKGSDSSLSFLVPANGRAVSNIINVSETLRLAKVLAFTLHGFDCGRSAGHTNEEELLCDYVHKAVDGVSRSSRNQLNLDLPAAAASILDWSTGQTNRIETPEEVSNILLKWTTRGGHETGIDRMWLSVENDGTVVVSGLLITMAKLGSKMTCGVLETQRSCLESIHIDTATVAGVLVKAERGFRDLLIGLKTVFPDRTLRLGKLHIFTTRNAAGADDKFRAKYPNNATYFNFEDELLLALCKETTLAADLPAAFAWQLHDFETGWLQDILPEGVTSRLGLPF